MQPFDRHPADAGALAASARQLVEQAAQAVDARRASLLAFAPAPANWDGIAAAELRAAPQPVRQQAFAVSSALSWASTALAFWAGRVAAFNERVAEIRAGLAGGTARLLSQLSRAAAAPDTDVAQAVAALEAQARKLWWLAYQADIVVGGQTAAGMLADGPTAANVAAARLVGLVPPGQPWTPLGPISTTFHRAGLGVPFPLMPWPWPPAPGECPLDDEYANNVVNGAADGAQLANALQLPFKEGLLQMLGGKAGDYGVDQVNQETGVCVKPIDLPEPPPPKDPPAPPQPSPIEEFFDDIGQGVEDFVEQLPDPTNPDTWPEGPFGPLPPLPPVPVPVP